MFYAKGSFTGNYQAAYPDELAAADFIIGHEYGAPEEGHYGAVNLLLARVINEIAGKKPVYAAPTIKLAMQEVNPDFKFAGVFAAVSSDALGTEGGTQSELRQAREKAGTAGGELTTHVAQAFHAGRVALQAENAGMTPLLPPGLPRDFDPDSVQPWCRNRALWIPRELLGVPVLKLKHQF